MAESLEEEVIRILGDRFKQVRLGGGVVGKTTYAMLGLVPVWIGIVWRMSSNLWEDALLLLAGIIVTGMVWTWVKSTHAFAEKNPLQAMLSGAEFVEYQRAFTAQTKNLSAPSNPTLVVGPNLPEKPSSDPTQRDQ